MGQQSVRNALLDRLREHMASLEQKLATIPETARAGQELRDELSDVRRLMEMMSPSEPDPEEPSITPAATSGARPSRPQS